MCAFYTYTCHACHASRDILCMTATPLETTPTHTYDFLCDGSPFLFGHSYERSFFMCTIYMGSFLLGKSRCGLFPHTAFRHRREDTRSACPAAYPCPCDPSLCNEYTPPFCIMYAYPCLLTAYYCIRILQVAWLTHRIIQENVLLKTRILLIGNTYYLDAQSVA